MGSPITGIRGKPGTFQMVTTDGRRHHLIHCSDSFKIFKFLTKPIRRISDERGEKTQCLVLSQGVHRMANLGWRQAWLLKIHAGKAVYLNVKETCLHS